MDKDALRNDVARLLASAGPLEAFLEKLFDLLRSVGSEERAAGAARTIPGMGESYGVPLPDLRIIAGELAKWGKPHPEKAFEFIKRLWKSGIRDGRVIAAKILERLGKREAEKTLEIASALMAGIRNWEECDQLACFGLRHVVQRRPGLVFPWCARWVKSEEKWTRRFGIAVLTSLPKEKGYRPSDREFAVLDWVMADPAREVQDAASWALREIGKRHPEPVVGYLKRYAKSANRFTRRIVKQAMKVLPQADREALQALLSSSGSFKAA